MGGGPIFCTVRTARGLPTSLNTSKSAPDRSLSVLQYRPPDWHPLKFVPNKRCRTRSSKSGASAAEQPMRETQVSEDCCGDGTCPASAEAASGFVPLRGMEGEQEVSFLTLRQSPWDHDPAARGEGRRVTRRLFWVLSRSIERVVRDRVVRKRVIVARGERERSRERERNRE